MITFEVGLFFNYGSRIARRFLCSEDALFLVFVILLNAVVSLEVEVHNSKKFKKAMEKN